MNHVDTTYFHRLHYEPEANESRLAWDMGRKKEAQVYEQFWKDREHGGVPKEMFEKHPKVWLEIGAGSGTFATSLGQLYPDYFGIALERCKMRGTRLAKRVERLGVKNVVGLRGNVIPTFMKDVPPKSLDRIYILYPCPWPKNSQRKNRWYLHTIMPKIVQSLKPGGWILWASDQEFYIKEARWVSEEIYKMKTLEFGPLKPNAYNEFDKFPQGRSTFESNFLAGGQPCYELVSQVPEAPLC